jgi:hypothetical protein
MRVGVSWEVSRNLSSHLSQPPPSPTSQPHSLFPAISSSSSQLLLASLLLAMPPVYLAGYLLLAQPSREVALGHAAEASRRIQPAPVERVLLRAEPIALHPSRGGDQQPSQARSARDEHVQPILYSGDASAATGHGRAREEGKSRGRLAREN